LGTDVYLAFALLLAVPVIILPLSLTRKYQTVELFPAYVPSYYAYLAEIAVLSVGAGLILPKLARLPRGLFVLLCGTGVLCITASTTVSGIASDAVIRAQRESAAKWQVFNSFARTPAFVDLPGNAVLLAPTLWEGIDPLYGYANTYWSRYAKAHFRKDLRIVKTLSEAMEERRNLLYYGEVIRLPGEGGAVFALASVDPLSPSHLILTSSEVTLFGDRDYKNVDLSGISAGCITDSPQERNDRCRVQVKVPPFHFIHNAFLSRVPGGRFAIPGFNLVYSSSSELQPSVVQVEFGRGFSALERSGGTYWRWSDGSSGRGILTLTNSLAQPARVRFRAIVRTRHARATRFDVSLNDDLKTVQLKDGDPVDWTIDLAPGTTEIAMKSYGERIGTGEDGRYLVFALEGWRLDVLATDTEAPGSAAPVEARFTYGFAGEERSGPNYWRWSNARDGQGVIELVNRSEREVAVIFEGLLSTLGDLQQKCEVTFGSSHTLYQITEKPVPLSQQMILTPGVTTIRIKSFAPIKILPQPDTRTMAFALSNWRLRTPSAFVSQF
jgi:hypothetical protein